MLLPGAGVGGHCIPKDPWLLAYGVDGKDVALSLIPAARAVNDGMPAHILALLAAALQDAGQALMGAKILVMGYAYLEDSDDTRNSPSQALVLQLQAAGAQAVVHDPYVEEYAGDLLQAAEGCDAAVLMVKHSAYKELDFGKLKEQLSADIFIDGRGMFIDKEPPQGFLFNVIGRGKH
jgi:UDP-N-acetyl-D-mannosaminuronic acid dehydrogenase